MILPQFRHNVHPCILHSRTFQYAPLHLHSLACRLLNRGRKQDGRTAFGHAVMEAMMAPSEDGRCPADRGFAIASLIIFAL